MVKLEQRLNIKALSAADRPREKLITHGRRHLSDAELMAILLRSGNSQENAVELGQRILCGYKNDLYDAGNASVNELCKFKGVGEAKALTIIAALELGRRRRACAEPLSKSISCSKDIFELLLPAFADLEHEEFWVLTLNRANVVTGRFMVSKGGMTGTIADPKIIFKMALERNAAYLILAHNHPSGNMAPSEQDIRITKNLVLAGEMLEIQVLDHLIITNLGYYSLSDEGIM